MAKLIFNYAAMNSGKSIDLLRTVYNYEENGLKVLVMKPSIDTKGGDSIVTRAGLSRKVDFLISSGSNIIEMISDSINGQITSYNYYFPEILQNIIKDLEECNLTMVEIAKKYSINTSTVSRINSGKIHIQEGRVYPIRISLKNELKQNYCCDCGKVITSRATRCPRCYQINQRVIERPGREELKQLIRITPFTKIGEKFKVSDNAVRKWCKTYNLPFRTKDIKVYSDEEWEKL